MALAKLAEIADLAGAEAEARIAGVAPRVGIGAGRDAERAGVRHHVQAVGQAAPSSRRSGRPRSRPPSSPRSAPPPARCGVRCGRDRGRGRRGRGSSCASSVNAWSLSLLAIPPPRSARRRSSNPGRRCSRSNGRRRGSGCRRGRRRAAPTDARARVGAARHRQVEHLVEVAVVDKAAPIDRDQVAAHHAVEVGVEMGVLEQVEIATRTGPWRSASSRSAGSACWRACRAG